jgi:hypothetical protein
MSRKGRLPQGASPFKDSQPETSFIDTFEKIDDPRGKRNKLYSCFSFIEYITF